MKIQWTEPAVLDLEDIRDFISRDSVYYASEFVAKILNIVEKLDCFPNVGRRVPEVEDDSIREIIFHNYRVIYQIREQVILILGVIHAARDLSNMQPNPWEAT